MEIPKDAREVYLDKETGEPIAYCPKDSLGMVDLVRIEVYNINRDRLAELALRAKAKETKESKFVVICIDANDSTWTPLVDILMPGHDWQSMRNRGEHPFARGVVPRGLVEEVAKMYPACGELPKEMFFAVCAAGGVSFFPEKDSLPQPQGMEAR